MPKINSKISDRISDIVDSDLTPPQITLYSYNGAFIDGCCGIIEYTPDCIRLNCKKVILKINGENLQIRADSIEQISLTGKIISIDFSDL